MCVLRCGYNEKRTDRRPDYPVKQELVFRRAHVPEIGRSKRGRVVCRPWSLDHVGGTKKLLPLGGTAQFVGNTAAVVWNSEMSEDDVISDDARNKIRTAATGSSVM